jgi:hypothetical protein
MVEDGQLGEIHAVEASCLDPQDKDGEYRWNDMNPTMTRLRI